MERALKSFLDGISEDDNVVKLESDTKKDKSAQSDHRAPQVEVIAQGSASGMLDMREMAKRYQQMSARDMDKPEAKPAVEPPLPGQLVRPTLLAPVVEVDDSEEGRGWLIAVVALGVLVTIVSTAAITAVFVKRSVMAEIRDMGLVPQSSLNQSPAASGSVERQPQLKTAQVAEWPESSGVVVREVGDDRGENEMNFRETEVGSIAKRPKTDLQKQDTPHSLPTVVLAKPKAPLPEPTVSEPATAPVPQAKVAKDGEPCDEVLCIVEGRGCCGTAKVSKPQVAEVDTSLPERLDRNDIKTGLAKIDGRLNSCGVRFETSGVVTLKLSIGADGKVRSGSANKGGDEFQSCISKTLKKARFAKTQQGGNLNYPVILR